MNYQNKYLKYKNKYLSLKNQLGGTIIEVSLRENPVYFILYIFAPRHNPPAEEGIQAVFLFKINIMLCYIDILMDFRKMMVEK